MSGNNPLSGPICLVDGKGAGRGSVGCLGEGLADCAQTASFPRGLGAPLVGGEEPTAISATLASAQQMCRE